MSVQLFGGAGRDSATNTSLPGFSEGITINTPDIVWFPLATVAICHLEFNQEQHGISKGARRDSATNTSPPPPPLGISKRTTKIIVNKYTRDWCVLFHQL